MIINYHIVALGELETNDKEAIKDYCEFLGITRDLTQVPSHKIPALREHLESVVSCVLYEIDSVKSRKVLTESDFAKMVNGYIKVLAKTHR